MKLSRSTRALFVAGTLVAGLLVAAPLTAGAAVTIAPTQTPTQTAPGPNDTTTVATVDPTTGQVVAQWSGPASEKAAVLATQRAAIAATHPVYAQPPRFSPQIVRQSPCTAGTGYFEIWNYPPLVCFANSGSTSVSIGSVYEFDTGNNVGGVHYTCGGTCNSGAWGKWTTVLFNPFPTVTLVYIQ